MSTLDLHNNEIGIKIVYYGPGLGGKTSSLQHMHKVLKPENRGKLISLATGIDRTLYFDFLPIHLPRIRDFSIRMSVYTVPGQVHYDATRKLVLQGADGVVFVADSQPAREEANRESLENLFDNLQTHGMNPNTVPLVFQYNKRDLPDTMPVAQMENQLNKKKVPAFETNAVSGDGVFPALKAITKLVLADLKKKGVYGERAQTIVPSITRDPRDDDTTTIVTVTETPSDPASGDSNSFEFATTMSEESTVQPVNGETSASIAAAVAQVANSRKPAHPTAVTPSFRLSHLWLDNEAHDEMVSLEEAFEEGALDRIPAGSKSVLETRLNAAGSTHRSLEEALLLLGTPAAHYIRYKEILERPQISVADAVFCLFFVTDVALRMQAAGVSS